MDKPESQPKWYTMTPEAVGKELGVDPAKGLSAGEAQQRLQKYGLNELVDRGTQNPWKILTATAPTLQVPSRPRITVWELLESRRRLIYSLQML